MNDAKDIMSIVKYGKYYWVYLPYIDAKCELDKRCKWWGCYDTFDECFEVLQQKDKEYNHLVIDDNLLRKIKINEILNNKENRS